MRTLGLGILLAGIAFLLASAALFGWLLWGAFDAHEVARVPIELGEEFVSEPIGVRGDRMCQLAVRCRIESDETRQERAKTFDDEDEFTLLYHLPFHYVVTAGNETIVEATEAIDGRNHVASWSRSGGTRNGGWIEATFWFDKFAVPDGTREISVRARVEPDEEFESEASGLELIVTDDAEPLLGRILAAILCAVLGLIATIVGAVLFSLNPASRDALAAAAELDVHGEAESGPAR